MASRRAFSAFTPTRCGQHADDQRPLPSQPELLVGYGFRGWITGCQTGNVACWEQVWRLYSNVLSPPRAKVVLGCLSSFAKSVNAASRNSIKVSEMNACQFNRDECLAISMVAASQHHTCPAMRACAFALIESNMLDEVLHHADTYALTLRSQNEVVSPEWIVNANMYVDASPELPH
jgi:hypothetical protein